VVSLWKRREIAWSDVAGFELARHFPYGRALYVELRNGDHIPMPYPSPGNAHYDKNLERLRQWHSAYGHTERSADE
jgi:hypothetical protein